MVLTGIKAEDVYENLFVNPRACPLQPSASQWMSAGHCHLMSKCISRVTRPTLTFDLHPSPHRSPSIFLLSVNNHSILPVLRPDTLDSALTPLFSSILHLICQQTVASLQNKLGIPSLLNIPRHPSPCLPGIPAVGSGGVFLLPSLRPPSPRSILNTAARVILSKKSDQAALLLKALQWSSSHWGKG